MSKVGETIYWTGSEDEEHRELLKACEARCRRWGKDGCPQPDHFCDECQHDMAVALRTRNPQTIKAIQNGEY